MGILGKLFGRNKDNHSNEIAPVSNLMCSQTLNLIIHPDLQNLLWIADGPQKNYFPKPKEQVFEHDGVRISFSCASVEEPSLISSKYSIQSDVNPSQVDRLPYFPTYSELTPAQRGVYWSFLANPYSGKFEIGYVFILYYGLERHLLEGNWEEAFRVILRLRDAYDNPSFQGYSACALILTCLIRKQPDFALKFYDSLDNKYELNFSDNLYLLCKMGLNQPLTAEDIMRMAKTFEFSNQNYIKKYPDLFLEKLTSAIYDQFGTDSLEIDQIVTKTEWRKLKRQVTPIFANISIRNRDIEIPLVSESFKLKRIVFHLLENAHEVVKKELAERRRNGEIPKVPKTEEVKKKIVLSFDPVQEKEYILEYKKTSHNPIDRHFSLIQLQNFYYRFRELDKKYLEICVSYCDEDIKLLTQVQAQYVKDEQENICKLYAFYSQKEITEKLNNIGSFKGDIPAFKRLAIIYEKQKDYVRSMDICDQAVAYYSKYGMPEAAQEFEERRQKLELKRTSQNRKK